MAAQSPDAVMQRLHDEHAGALWGHCLRLTNYDRARAEDVCQETLLRAWRNASILDESQGSVRAWLFTVARNIVIDESRTKRARSEIPMGELPEPGARRRQRRAADHLAGGRRGDPALAGAPGRAPGDLLQRSCRWPTPPAGSASPREP